MTRCQFEAKHWMHWHKREIDILPYAFFLRLNECMKLLILGQVKQLRCPCGATFRLDR